MYKCISLTVLAMFFSATNLVSAKEFTIETLSWMSGCWALKTAEKGSVEYWLSPAGGSMLGVARTIKNGKIVTYEFLQVRETSNGGIEYVALPSGQSETTFIATAVDDKSVVFENLQHDFPNRITYKKNPNNTLIVIIAGLQKGSETSVDFLMEKAACDVTD